MLNLAVLILNQVLLLGLLDVSVSFLRIEPLFVFALRLILGQHLRLSRRFK